ncbi:SPW repeat domain-containing protein [Dactylosporangium sp. CA-233914]|uniref:SPW repeat domain-containing protein n=1 Tax=Dactylosporangium sp. CA-233914 TaxID=3239934 RepID=UPI003D8D337C
MSFISDQDFTTPAHVRGGDRPDFSDKREQTPRRAPLVVIFLAAVWLVVAAVPFGYIGAGRYDAFWSDAVTGVTIAIVTAIRLLVARSTAFGWVTAGLATWLLLAPLVLQYGWSASTVNDVCVGMLMMVCVALSAEG